MFVMKVDGFRGDVIDVPAKLYSLGVILLFSKLNKILVGYFHPCNIFLDNENK